VDEVEMLRVELRKAITECAKATARKLALEDQLKAAYRRAAQQHREWKAKVGR
jgi:hypothetical protein